MAEETGKFDQWFKDSKVIEPDGTPRIVYHGTDQSFDFFDSLKNGQKDTGWYGIGHYATSDPTTASAYSGYAQLEDAYAPLASPNVMALYVSLQNPYIWPRGRRAATTKEESEEITRTLIAQGFDGVIVSNENAAPDYADQYEIIAFYPEQIKSATGNNGQFDPLNSDIRFSFAGPRAATADQALLSEANTELSAGADGETVRKATGWFKGIDGKMRFEIGDEEAFTKGVGTFEEVIMRWYQVGVGRTGDQLYKTKVSDVIRHPALFEAYPGIAEMEIQMMPSGISSNGRVASSEGVQIIQIQGSLPMAQWLSVMLHEIQHGIQTIEGFAQGGSSRTMNQEIEVRPYKEVALMMRVWEMVTGETSNYSPSQLESAADASEYLDDYFRDVGNAVATPEIIEVLSNHGYSTRLEPGDSLSTYSEILADAARHDIELGKVGKNQYRQYLNLAGEVEARNTQARQTMTMSERMEKSPVSTQDVNPVDMTVRFDSAEMMSDQDMTAESSSKKPALTMYHGSTAGDGIKTLNPDRNGLIFLTPDKDYASDYATNTRRSNDFAGHKARVYEVGVSVGNVLDMMNLPPYSDQPWQIKLADVLKYPPLGGEYNSIDTKVDWKDIEAFGGPELFSLIQEAGFDGVSHRVWTRHGNVTEMAVFDSAVIDLKPATSEKTKPNQTRRKEFVIEMEGQNTAVATVGKRTVGRANGWMDHRDKFVIMNSEVLKGYQRRGIASEMYKAIETSSGRLLTPAVSLSDDAFAFWKSFRPESVALDLRHWRDQLIGARVSKNGLSGKIIKASGGTATMEYDEAQPNGTQSTIVRSQLNAVLRNAGSPEIDFTEAQEQARKIEKVTKFKEWFRTSKAVDSAGKPLTLHHGSRAEFDVFEMDKARDGAHWFTPNESHAASFGDRIKEVYISIQNPLEISQDDLDAAWDVEHPDGYQDERSLLPRDFVKDFVKHAKEKGHDGLIIRDMGDREIQSDMFLPFSPEQIKLATENEAFSVKNPDIRYSKAPGIEKVSVKTFEDWFFGSKVIDSEGKPLTLFHGSPSQFSTFDFSGSMDGGVYFTQDKKLAESFSKDEDGELGFTYEVFLNFRNPISIDLKGEQQPSQDEMRKIFDDAKASGYDSFVLNGVKEFNGIGTQYIAFEASQISFSSDFSGEYNPDLNEFKGQSVEVMDHDKWSIYQEHSAQLNDGFVRWVEDRDSIYITDIQAGPNTRGREILSWLKDSSSKELQALGVVDDAGEFWEKMEAEELIKGQIQEDFVSFFGLGTRFSNPNLGFYSELEVQIKKSGMSQAPSPAWIDFIQALSKKGVKSDEITWSGVLDWLSLQGGKVSKDALLTYLESNGVQVDEIILKDGTGWSVVDQGTGGDHFLQRFETKKEALDRVQELGEQEFGAIPDSNAPQSETKYAQYVLEGGTNYREVLLTLPVIENNINEDVKQKTKRSVAMRELQKEFEAEGNVSRASVFSEKAKKLEELVAQLKTLPKQKSEGNFQSSHWDQANVIAHIRLNDRVGINGKKILFVEELQSDWQQTGKKNGFSNDLKLPPGWRFEKMDSGIPPVSGWMILDNEDEPTAWAATKEGALKDAAPWIQSEPSSSVPSAPFVTKTDAWLALALKHIVKLAVDGGYDQVAFITGDQSSDRYQLSKNIVQITSSKNDDGKFQIFMRDAQGRNTNPGTFEASQLKPIVGQDLALKITNQAKTLEIYEDINLEIGGEGMKYFYDKIIPNALKPLLKSVDGDTLIDVHLAVDIDQNQVKLDEDLLDELGVELPDVKAPSPQFGFEITPALRKKVSNGMPLFSQRERAESSEKASEFMNWFEGSLVTKANGEPLVVYRGEHGAMVGSSPKGMQTRMGSISFGSPQTASRYALHPNDESQDREIISPRVMPSYLQIRQPLINDFEDPFIEIKKIRSILGDKQARRIAMKFADEIEDTGNWQENYQESNPFIRPFIRVAPIQELDDLYFKAFYYLDDKDEIELLKEKGFDGAIYGGSGISAMEPEYRVFSDSQVKNAISERWAMQAPAPRPSEPVATPKSTISKVRAALGQITGQRALKINEGMGRVVVTTSSEIKVPCYPRISTGALASLIKNPALMKIIEDGRAARSRTIEAIGDLTDCVIVRKTTPVKIKKSEKPSWMMILPDASEPGRWRTQSFDEQGFSGHSTFDTFELAIDDAAKNNFTTRDDGALDRIQESPVFQRGIFSTDLVARVNAGKINLTEADSLLAKYDETAKIFMSIAASGAQAFITADSETIYLLADRIDEGSEAAVFLHEIVHRHGRHVLGQDSWRGMHNTLNGWATRSLESKERKIYDAASARARSASGTKKDLFEEELFAYSVEEAVSRGIKPSAMGLEGSAEKWLDTVTASLKLVTSSVLKNTGASHALSEMSAQQLVDLAYALAQIDSPDRMNEIMRRMTPDERSTLNGLVNRSGLPQWYSQLELKVRQENTKSMASSQWIQWLKAQAGNGVKSDEIHWSGVSEWLSLQTTRVTQQKLLDYLQSNGVKVEERMLLPMSEQKNMEIITKNGFRIEDFDLMESSYTLADKFGNSVSLDDVPQDVSDAFKTIIKNSQDIPCAYDDDEYRAPGGLNYREVLLTLPEPEKKPVFHVLVGDSYIKKTDAREEAQEFAEKWGRGAKVIEKTQDATPTYYSPHWDFPNILAHIRMDDRTNEKGEKVLFIHEIQSDWAQDGRKKGFIDGEPLRIGDITLEGEVFHVHDQNGRPILQLDAYEFKTQDAVRDYAEREISKNKMISGTVLSGPFVSNTSAWVTLAIKRITRIAIDEGYASISFVNGEQSANRYKQLKNKKGMIDFYEKIIPIAAKNVLKMYKGENLKPMTIRSSVLDDTQESRQIGFDITPEMRKVSQAGMPLFSISAACSTAFKEWSEGLNFVSAEAGCFLGGSAVFEAFHGTTHTNITKFEKRGSKDGFLGQGPYFTTSAQDASSNYAGIGPDLTNRINDEVKNMSSDVDDYGMREMLRDYYDAHTQVDPVEGWEDENTHDAWDSHGDGALRLAAESRLVGDSSGFMMKLFVKLTNPADTTGNGPDLTYETQRDFEGNAQDESGTLVDWIMSARSVAQSMNLNIDEYIDELFRDSEYDDFTIGMDEVFRISLKHFSQAFDEDGELLQAGGVFREIAHDAGYDGVIMDADLHFGTGRFGFGGARIPSMPGVKRDTLHIIPFSSEQVKSAIGNNGEFNAANPDIRFSLPKLIEKHKANWEEASKEANLLSTSRGFKNALKPFKDEIYEGMINAHDCGPFDGGCVVFAQALQRVIGGKVVVITNSGGQADHAAVALDGKIYDFDGPLKPAAFMARFEKNEHVKITGYRDIQQGDLLDAIRCDKLEVKLVSQLLKALHPELKNSDSHDDHEIPVTNCSRLRALA